MKLLKYRKEKHMLNPLFKKFRIANLALFVCAMVCLVCYDTFRGVWLKGFTSLWFVLIGLVNLIFAKKTGINNTKPVYFIFTGLFLGMCADVLLAVFFEAGIVAFALGHVMYLAAFYMLQKPRKADFVIAIPVIAVSVYIVIGTPFITIEDSFIRYFLIVYAVIISLMLSKAWSNFIAGKSAATLIIAFSSALFWFSDLMLAVDMFGTPSRLVWILCSYSYWPAQNLIAHSMFHFVKEQQRQKIHRNTLRVNTKEL
ncbi:MAG: lysoplasmalogenase [Ruminococcaceae bacterium]|nr:lysoplasmalogenase [Oscillospiraceae bacterium]